MLIYCISITRASFASPNVEGIQEYQKNLHLYSEHKQKLADDILRYQNADNLWDVLRQEFSLAHYEDNPYVQAQIEILMNQQDLFLESASRAGPYLYYILQQVRKRHLPAELVLLPIMESGYNPYAYSTAGAAGLWQMMPGTASGFGIKQNGWYDGRRDLIASTRGALMYLVYLQNFFDGNWLLALAAYDAGEGTVLSAIKKNIRNGESTDFWSLPLPQETRDYVPRLLALAIIVSHPEQYPLYLPYVRNAPYLAQVDVGEQISLTHAANLAGMALKKLLQLNPGFNHSAAALHGPSKLILPIEKVEQFTENLAQSPLHHSINWTRYKVKSRDTLVSIAKHFHISVSTLKDLNRIGSVKSGTLLLIPNTTSNINDLSNNKNITLNPPEEKSLASQNVIIPVSNKDLEKIIPGRYQLMAGDTVYMVRPHESLNNIAERFHFSASLLKQINNLSTKEVKNGKQIIIPTHLEKSNNPQKSKNKLNPGDTVYMVRRGDTVEKIAEKFHVSPALIRVSNLMEKDLIHEGDHLTIPAPLGV